MIYRREAALGILRGLWRSIDKDRRRLLEEMTDADMHRFIAMLPLPGPEPGEETRLLPDCKDHVQALIYVEDMSSVDRVQQLLELQLTHRAVEAAMERTYEFLDHTRRRLYKLFDSRHDKKRQTGPTGLRYVTSTDDLDVISEDDALHEATWGESFAWEIDDTWTVAEADSTRTDDEDW
ncbi:unnamed protein product [Parascedosporium putredinis]|uniref:Uncharacterized protein n=1 Tax=Parascedosporium putredinis TaxID=1442378 RepID=A0A9P1GYW8_9PEZI|nr:unnamed protein product [Parascedosporium putredinis]CAI7991167.1 unnamed protein product [Parascedosporium putredinis]